jgi:hypothetical protein
MSASAACLPARRRRDRRPGKFRYSQDGHQSTNPRRAFQVNRLLRTGASFALSAFRVGSRCVLQPYSVSDCSRASSQDATGGSGALLPPTAPD